MVSTMPPASDTRGVSGLMPINGTAGNWAKMGQAKSHGALEPRLPAVLPPGKSLRCGVDRALGPPVLGGPPAGVPAGTILARARDVVRLHARRDHGLPLHRRTQLDFPADANRAIAG